MRSLTVIPARGGSKGIPYKNIYPVNGKPLILYTLEIFKKVKLDGDIVVSTDSNEIANAAMTVEGIHVIKRPVELASDTARTEDALIHALDFMRREYNRDYDVVITAQPTSPLRKVETIKAFIQEFEKKQEQYDAQMTLTETRTDYWKKNENGDCERLFPNAPRRRQEREPLYIENSMLYITKEKVLRETKSVLGTKVNGFLINEVEGLDINDWNDIELAEFYLKTRGKEK